MGGENTLPLPELPPADDLGHKPDDDKIALKLVPELRGKLAFFHGCWRMYKDGWWEPRDIYEMRRYLKKQLRQFRSNAVQVNQARVKALASMLEDELYISDRVIMEAAVLQRDYIPLRNGLFNLKTMALEAHRPDLYFTVQLDFYYDPDATVTYFQKFLNTSLVKDDGSGKTDWDLVTLTCEALGYCLTARTDMKASFWLVGEKDSGKSTFIAMIKALMGNLHTTLDLTQLGTNRFLLSSVVGKRVVTFTESSGSSVLPDALYKTLTGGSDEVYADVKNRDPIVFRPDCKIVWSMNEMPRMSDRSGATARRIHIIPFNRTIPEGQRIPDLEDKLASEKSAIFNVLVSHLIRLRNAGNFTECEQSQRRKQEYIMENDTEATFIQDCAELHESYKVQSSALYSRYSSWCLDNGFKPRNSNQVAKEWTRLGFTRARSGQSWWHGLRLRGI